MNELNTIQIRNIIDWIKKKNPQDSCDKGLVFRICALLQHRRQLTKAGREELNGHFSKEDIHRPRVWQRTQNHQSKESIS